MQSFVIFVIGAAGGLAAGIVLYLALCVVTSFRITRTSHADAHLPHPPGTGRRTSTARSPRSSSDRQIPGF